MRTQDKIALARVARLALLCIGIWAAIQFGIGRVGWPVGEALEDYSDGQIAHDSSTDLPWWGGMVLHGAMLAGAFAWLVAYVLLKEYLEKHTGPYMDDLD